jgi:Na+-transporting NADH:ubiquinone oxidoreductase subunit B
MSLRSWLDSIEHHFEKGGKYEKYYALYEAVDTALYKPPLVTRNTAHVRDGLDLKRMMITVWLCTFPAMFFGMWNVGYQANTILAGSPELMAAQEGWRIALTSALAGLDPASLWANFLHGATYFLPIYLTTFIVGGFWEVLFASIRKHEVNEGFFVTSVLFALTLPPDTPLWQVALGISFGVVIARKSLAAPARTSSTRRSPAAPSCISPTRRRCRATRCGPRSTASPAPPCCRSAPPAASRR